MRASWSKAGLSGLVVLALSVACGGPSEPTVDATDGGQTDAGQVDGAHPDAAQDGAGADAAADTAAPDATEPPWPQTLQPLPPCEPATQTFAIPELSASGDIALESAAWAQATGLEQVIWLRVRKKGSQSTDTKATGTPTLTAAAGVEVLGVEPAVAGVARARVRFDQPGKHVLTAELGDRTGTAELYAYASKLPIWELEIAPADLQAMIKDPYAKKYFPAVVKAEGKVFAGAEVRLHGGTSVDYYKKSFRINLAKGDQLASGERKLVLRAEYIDKTLLRTFLGYELFRNATWIPSPKTEFVHFRVNGELYGVMNHVQRIGGDFLEQWSRDPDGALYESDPPLAKSQLGNLTPIEPDSDYAEVYQAHGGVEDFAPLIAFIEQDLQLPEAEFHAKVAQFLDVDGWLAYAAGMAVLQNHEHIRKNFYLYRDVTGGGRWEIFPWDLDLTFGHLWTEENDVMDESIFFDRDLLVGLQTPQHGFFNQLYRVLNDPARRQRFDQFIAKVAEVGLSPQFLDSRIDWALCRLHGDVLADKRKRAGNAEYLERVEEIRAYAQQRKAFIAQELAAP